MRSLLYLLYMIKVWILTIFYPSKGTYDMLYHYKTAFSAEKYVRIRNKLFGRVERTIQRKKEKSVRIIMVDCTEWATTQIYDYFSTMKGVDIAVVLSPFFNGTDESIRKAYNLCREFCESRRLRYLDAYDTAFWELLPEYVRDIYGDVMIYTNPWMGSYPKEINIRNVPLSSITCYIPYGFMLFKHEQKQFNQVSHNMFTYIYCETEVHRQMYAKYCDIGNSHVKYAGHPKMDWYIEDKKIDDSRIWKGLSENQHKIKILYSPHWILGETGTFIDNGLQILKYAEEHIETTSWIYKPHPLLEKEVVVRGYMTAGEYQEYVARWESLPNAKVYLLGDYSDMFLSSDCMINDSVSFIAEYMYSHKPMLLLTNGSAMYNDFGEECKKYVYTCNSKDIAGIEEFISNIAKGKDNLKVERENFFSKHLDYYGHNEKKASEYINLHILGILG